MTSVIAPVKTRCITRHDFPEVLDIERSCYQDCRWHQEDFIHELTTKNVVGVVAVRQGNVVGYAIYELHKQSVEIRNIAVHPIVQRQGIGTSLVRRTLQKLEDGRRVTMTADVRDSNLPGQLFFGSCGFTASQIKSGRYDNHDTAYHFVFRRGWPLPGGD